jgi:beta-lactamase class A
LRLSIRHMQRPARSSLVVILALATILTLQPYPSSTVRAQGAVPVNMLYGSAPDIPDSQLQSIVNDVVGGLPSTWGVAVKKLDTGQFAEYNGDAQQVSASLYKVWVLAELYNQVSNGQIGLDDSGTITSDDTSYDSQQGNESLAPGYDITYRDAARLMITISDNTASAFLVRNLGPDNINNFIQQSGLQHSDLDWSGVGDNMTTPLDMMYIFEKIATSKLVDAESSEEMLNLLLDQQINDRFPADLPPEARIAHKTGDLDSLLHDAAIIYGPTGPFVIVAMSSNLATWTEALDNMPVLARRVYDYFNTQPSSPARYFPETKQTVGHEFLKFWNDYGGVDTFGYPIGPEHLQNGMLTQSFERARLELHPENTGAGGPEPTVGLGLIGEQLAGKLGLSWQPSTNDGKGIYFDATQQEITGDFLYYWQNHGGERVFGWPISPAENMVNPADGKTYLTQWFQRARMEFHPDLPVGHRIVLGSLGTELANSDD